ncbi:MAG: hypothetical protein ACI308_11565 [Muribaculaceae bacterium]
MTYKSIVLKKGSEEFLKRFHPWVFSGAIHNMEPCEDGDLVTVYTSNGELIGNGHYQLGSIAVRMLSFDDSTINEDYYHARLLAAYNTRLALDLMRENNNSFRLVHGEGDFLPGLVVDIYGNTAVMQAHSPGMHFARETIAKALVRLPNNLVKNGYYKSETTLSYITRESENY